MTDGPNTMRNGNGHKAKLFWQVIQIFIVFLLSLNTALVGWTMNKVVSLSEDVSAIKASRFTAADGLQVWKEMATKADKSDVPAPEVLRRLDAAEQRIESLSNRITR